MKHGYCLRDVSFKIGKAVMFPKTKRVCSTSEPQSTLCCCVLDGSYQRNLSVIAFPCYPGGTKKLSHYKIMPVPKVKVN